MSECEITEIAPQTAAVVHGELPMSELPGFYERAFPAVMAALAEQGVAPAGAPFGYYPSMPAATVVVEAGIPTAGPIEAAGDVEPRELPGGRMVTAVHVGPYDTLPQTYGEMERWMRERGVTPRGGPFESYETDPGEEPDQSKWETRIHWPIAS